MTEHGTPEADDAMTDQQKNSQEPTSSFRRPANLMTNASFLSRLCFIWPYPLLKLGLQRPLEETDLHEILEADTSQYNRQYFEAIWQQELKRRPSKPSLHRALFWNFITSIWYCQPMLMASAAARVIQAVALGYLIEAFDNDNSKDAYQWAGVLVAAGVVILFEHHHVFFISWRKGMQLRLACVAAIQDKAMRLSSTHQETSASTGKIMNMASNDVERFILASLFIHYLWWSPLNSISILITGWTLLGPAFAAGFALLLFFFVPFQFKLSQKFGAYRSKIAAITDRRVTFVSQAVHGARVMKMSGYEWRFLERIQQLRAEETDAIARANRLKAWNETLFFSANIIISVVIFLVHVFSGEELTARNVFTVFTLINVLQLEMTNHFSLGVMGASEVYVSIERIQNFLEFAERPSPDQPSDKQPPNNLSHDVALALSHVSCNWDHVQNITTRETEDKDSPNGVLPALSDVSVDFQRGKLTCIIGTVGCGKSALIQALVGELHVTSGTLARSYQSLAYASQDAWVMDGTVRDNITMGQTYDQDWYDQVVNSCGLAQDFTQFLNGDQTIVGDRGVQCSGGQRARIGLARALYRDADVLIVDDPLSAVDAKVGRQLFQEALLGLGVSRGKCVIVATHQHQYVHDYRCVLIKSGAVQTIGSYDECVVASGGHLHAHAADSAVDNLDNGDEEATTKENGMDKNAAEQSTEKKGKDTENVVDEDAKEDKAAGEVRFETYLNYARAMGGLGTAALLVVLFTITQGAALSAVAMMGRWAEKPAAEQKDWNILGPVIGLSASVVLLASCRSLLCFALTIKASRTLHDRMAKSVLRAKISFFDTNPLGRILNRFSADVGSNDDLLPITLFGFSVMSFIILGAIATTATVLPFALVVGPPLVWYFLSVRRIFVTSTRELKRLEGLARSPIFAMLSEALSGIATIRANQSMDYFTKKFQVAHDGHTRAVFGFIAASRWVGFRMDLIMFLLLTSVSFLAALCQDREWFNIDSSILGLSISLLIQLAGLFQWCVRQSAEVVNQMVSVERVLSYGGLEPEAPLQLDSDEQLKPTWPQDGAMDVKDLAVRYRPALPLALDGATFSIPKGSRVGVVGRTGSGKSTVVQTLFRLLEAERGSISIDGVDISKVGLHRLRTRISVIPQMPTLFSGCTVRENLDLFGNHSEDAIKKALEDAHMGDAMSKLPQGFNSMVSEGGTNFSVGQRQLLCLARAILTKNKLLILDEATASVDRRTDEMLHKSLDHSFNDATIVAVAHRLDTVIEHDYILVLGGGKVLEFGPPAELLRSRGPFSKMVEDTGDDMSKDLRQRALEKEKEDDLQVVAA